MTAPSPGVKKQEPKIFKKKVVKSHPSVRFLFLSAFSSHFAPPSPAAAPAPSSLSSPPPAPAPAPSVLLSAPAPSSLPSAPTLSPISSAPAEPSLAAVCGQTENKLLLRPPTTVPSASIIINPFPFVHPTSVATKKRTAKTGDGAFFYPNKSSNSARNLFAINYCHDHPKTTKGDFENAWKIVEGDPEKKAFYVKLSLHNKASSLKPDMKGSVSSTLS
ncbi:hypothetical protein JB92DRAFT_3091808 [Gautieria morchelliformis]|nr:hypothetical protein JB92DRAFT_3091808 [Gautieria morchelliformis]